jgi:C1A family cysteine protease
MILAFICILTLLTGERWAIFKFNSNFAQEFIKATKYAKFDEIESGLRKQRNEIEKLMNPKKAFKHFASVFPESFGLNHKAEHRFKIFKKSFSSIQKENKKQNKVKFGITPFSDITDEEFENIFTTREYMKQKINELKKNHKNEANLKRNSKSKVEKKNIIKTLENVGRNLSEFKKDQISNRRQDSNTQHEINGHSSKYTNGNLKEYFTDFSLSSSSSGSKSHKTARLASRQLLITRTSQTIKAIVVKRSNNLVEPLQTNNKSRSNTNNSNSVPPTQHNSVQSINRNAISTSVSQLNQNKSDNLPESSRSHKFPTIHAVNSDRPLNRNEIWNSNDSPVKNGRFSNSESANIYPSPINKEDYSKSPEIRGQEGKVFNKDPENTNQTEKQVNSKNKSLESNKRSQELNLISQENSEDKEEKAIKFTETSNKEPENQIEDHLEEKYSKSPKSKSSTNDYLNSEKVGENSYEKDRTNNSKLSKEDKEFSKTDAKQKSKKENINKDFPNEEKALKNINSPPDDNSNYKDVILSDTLHNDDKLVNSDNSNSPILSAAVTNSNKAISNDKNLDKEINSESSKNDSKLLQRNENSHSDGENIKMDKDNKEIASSADINNEKVQNQDDMVEHLKKNPIFNTKMDVIDMFMIVNKDSYNLLEYPQRINWKSINKTTEVRTQKKCACCYAFSAIGALEAQLLIKRNHNTDLSEQQILECTDDYQNEGCTGGLPVNVYNYIIDEKIASEKDYEYSGEKSKCRVSKGASPSIEKNQEIPLIEITNLDYVIVDNNVLALIAALQFGPVAVNHKITKKFKLYAEGIIGPDICDEDNSMIPNHSTLLIGYDLTHETPHFILKNSWGEKWGENGFYRMVIGELSTSNRGACLLAEYQINVLPVIL